MDVYQERAYHWFSAPCACSDNWSTGQLARGDHLYRPAQVATLLASGQQDIRTFPSVHDQTEISIDVSSANPQHLFISCQIFGTVQGWFFSTDGGMNWTGSESPPPGLPLSSVGGDPVAVFDGSDIVYWVSLGTSSAGGIQVARSTDLGQSWTLSNADPLRSTTNHKAHAMTDKSGVYPNNIYVAWLDNTVPNGGIVLTRSTDHGLSWSSRFTFPIGSDGGGRY